jgi:hypothetical protein
MRCFGYKEVNVANRNVLSSHGASSKSSGFRGVETRKQRPNTH